MKRCLSIIYSMLTLFFSSTVLAQVGINTNTPDASSILDITSSNKGVLLPQYDLTVLNSTSTPIANPTDGLIIYNSKTSVSNPNPKGYYVWIKDKWQRFIMSGSEPQSMSLLIPSSQTITMIPTGSTDNVVTNFALAANKITGASLAADKSSITLPAGKYIIRYSGDFGFGLPGGTGTAPANTTYFGDKVPLCIRTYLVDISNNDITERNRSCQVTTGWAFSQGTFYLNLTSPTTFKQKFELDTGNGFTRDVLSIRSTYQMLITKMAQ